MEKSSGPIPATAPQGDILKHTLQAAFCGYRVIMTGQNVKLKVSIIQKGVLRISGKDLTLKPEKWNVRFLRRSCFLMHAIPVLPQTDFLLITVLCISQTGKAEKLRDSEARVCRAKADTRSATVCFMGGIQ